MEGKDRAEGRKISSEKREGKEKGWEEGIYIYRYGYEKVEERKR